MRKRVQKTKTEKRAVKKSKEICKLYDRIMSAYVDQLDQNPEIEEIFCNYVLDGLELGDFTSDFVCRKTDGDYMVRECVWEKFLMKPLTVEQLDASRTYWARRGVVDWGW